MGTVFAQDLAQYSDLSLRDAIAIHLTSNHYPPVPTTMVDACIEAINKCNEGDYACEVDLPEGVAYRGRTTAPAGAIVEGHHLESWLSEEEC
jgi:hypothetical protein